MKSTMLHRSSSRFSSGVPVRARRCSAFNCLHRLRDLRVRVLDELRLVEDQRAEVELAQLLQVAPQQRVVGDDDVVLRDLLAQVVPAPWPLWSTSTFRCGVNCSASRRQLCSTEAGQMHERGLGVLRVAVP
jgi:hypothetical protein